MGAQCVSWLVVCISESSGGVGGVLWLQVVLQALFVWLKLRQCVEYASIHGLLLPVPALSPRFPIRISWRWWLWWWWRVHYLGDPFLPLQLLQYSILTLFSSVTDPTGSPSFSAFTLFASFRSTFPLPLPLHRFWLELPVLSVLLPSAADPAASRSSAARTPSWSIIFLLCSIWASASAWQARAPCPGPEGHTSGSG